jgi:hypothetical protein
MQLKLLLAVVLALALGLEAALAQVPPRRKGPLLRWLRAGAYRQTYMPEPVVRASFTAHGQYVRTWYSPILVEDLRAGRPAFRRGAVMVKELFRPDSAEVRGWAVMRKLRPASGTRGQGWLFYERLPGGGTFSGRGLRLCTGCHQAGADYLLSPFRP